MPSNEKVEIFQDFTLGLNTLGAPNRIDPKSMPTMSNVWVDDAAIQKRLGQSRTSTTNTVYGGSWYGNSLHNSVFSGAENLLVYAYSATATRNILFSTTDGITVTPMSSGGTGTASTAVATAIVTGVGTNFLTVAAVGALFSIGNTVGRILTVDSDTQLTLTSNFGVLNTGAAYVLTNSWPQTTRVSFVDMNSKAWICGIGSTTVSFNGTTQVYVTAFPSAAYSIVYKNYVFAADTAANPSRVAWCSLKDPTLWPASNFIDVNPDDGFPIVGLAYDGQSIIIFKTNAAYKLTGDIFDPSNPTYTLTRIFTPPDFNINSAKSFQLYGPSGYIMLGKKGFYSYNGGGAISKILNYDIIRGEFSGIGGFNLGGIPAVALEPSSIIVDGNYWLQVPNATSSISTANKELTYVLDKTGAVWKWSQLGPAMVSDMAYLSGTLYGVNSYTSGTPGLLQLNTGNTDGLASAINGSVTSKVFEFSNQNRFGTSYVYFKKQSAGNLTYEFSIDEGAFTSNTISMTTGTGTRVKSAPIIVGRVGRSIQFRFSNNVAGETFEVYAVEISRQELRR